MHAYILIFEANGVILDPNPASKYFSEAEKKLFDSHKIKIPISRVKKEWSKIVKASSLQSESIEQMHAKMFMELGLPQSMLEEYNRLDTESFKRYAPMEQNEKPILKKLKALDFYLAILTDTIHTKEAKQLMLDAAGLDGIFDNVFVPRDTGYQTPAKGAYQAVLDYYKAEPENAIFISHDLGKLKGARLAGLKTISYKGPHYGDYYADSFEELFDIIKGIERESRSKITIE